VDVLPYSALTYARGPAEVARLARRLRREVRMFRRELRRRRPDLVIAVTTVLPAVVLAARLEGVPAVVYAAELYDRQRLGRGLSIGTALLAQGLVGCSDKVARQFPRWTRTPVSVAYPPIVAEYAGGDREAGRRRLGVRHGEQLILIVGSISRGRGQDLAVRALTLIRRSLPEARLAIVGDPHPRPLDLAFASELRKLTARLALEDAVIFTGAVDEIADAYAAADVVVNPARTAEAFGRVGPEALVAGRPVVATRVGAIPDVIRHDVDGLLVEPEDPEALAGAVLRVVGDRELATRTVEAGRQRALERFSMEQDLAAWREVVERAAGYGLGSS
jgi:glycosyltransferase involved in cell wall biosynthesis